MSQLCRHITTSPNRGSTLYVLFSQEEEEKKRKQDEEEKKRKEEEEKRVRVDCVYICQCSDET